MTGVQTCALPISMNVGIDDTLKYIEVGVDKGNIESEKSDEIIDLLNKYKKWR